MTESTPMKSLADIAHEARRKMQTASMERDLLCHFLVTGKPVPKGSMRVSHDKYGDAHMYSDQPGLKTWETAVQYTAKQAMRRNSPSSNPIEIVLEFVVPAPKRREGELWPIQKGTGDIDKLTRAMLDGMNGIVYVDDAQVVRLLASKRYCSSTRPVGVTVWVYAVPSV